MSAAGYVPMPQRLPWRTFTHLLRQKAKDYLRQTTRGQAPARNAWAGQEHPRRYRLGASMGGRVPTDSRPRRWSVYASKEGTLDANETSGSAGKPRVPAWSAR